MNHICKKKVPIVERFHTPSYTFRYTFINLSVSKKTSLEIANANKELKIYTRKGPARLADPWTYCLIV